MNFALLKLGIHAARANVVPAFFLWIFGTLIVFSYYFAPGSRPLFDGISALRDTYGIWYGMVSTAFFAGLIPFLMQGLQRGDSKRDWSLKYLLFLMALWAAKGLEVDFLYRLQAFLFGEVQGVMTIVLKVLFDQFVYVPLWGVPTLVIPMLFARSGYSLKNFKKQLRSDWYRRLILPVMLPNWFVWIPAATCIYLLPTPLQLPTQNVVLCLWVLMVMFMTGQQSDESRTLTETAPKPE
jgi:hypothetical protein